jgi:hypothetical protein
MGKPWPSATTLTFEPLPTLVFPIASPFFRWDKTAIEEGFGPLQLAVGIQLAQQCAPSALPDPLL